MTDKNTSPFVSIIMPIKNEECFIELSLGAVLSQDYPSNRMEVLIVDGKSTDRTRELVAKLAATSEISISIFDNPTGIVPKALNIGLRHAKGEIIIRVDGHCEIQKDYVQICLGQLLQQGVECVGGTIETVGETFIAKTIAIAMSAPLGVGNVAFRVSNRSTQLTDSVPFPAYPKKIFDIVGGFNEDMLCNEDDEFNYRLLNNNFRILLVSGLKTRYYCRGTLGGLWRQYFRYGLWKVRILQKHPRQMSLRQFVPPMFVLALLASALLAAVPAVRWFSLVVPTAYLAANLGASVFTALRAQKADRRSLSAHYLLLPLAFAILHLSYGLGFLLGLFKFWNRWGDKQGKVPAI